MLSDSRQWVVGEGDAWQGSALRCRAVTLSPGGTQRGVDLHPLIEKPGFETLSSGS